MLQARITSECSYSEPVAARRSCLQDHGTVELEAIFCSGADRCQILKRITADVSVQYTTIQQSAHTQHFVIVIEKPTCFGCTRQPQSCFTFIDADIDIFVKCNWVDSQWQ